MYKTPNLTDKGKRRCLINSFVGNHDLLCCCNEPAFHCLKDLITQLKPDLTKEQKQEIIKCLGTTDGDHTTEENIDDFGEDLEKLFEEDVFGDENG